MGATIFGISLGAIQEFDAAYAASLDPSRRALLSLPTASAERLAQAQQLALQGFIIDAVIMAYGSDPYLTMLERANDGLTWTPSAMQPSIAYQAGQPANPPFVPYDPTSPPVGSIPTVTDLTKLTPYDPPAPPPPAKSPVVGWLGMTADMLAAPIPALPAGVAASSVQVYSSSATVQYPEGYEYAQSAAAGNAPAGTYIYHMLGSDLMSPTERVAVWLLLPAATPAAS